MINPLLLLPPSVGSGGQRRLSGTAFLHEQKLGEDPEQVECQEAEQEIEQSGRKRETKARYGHKCTKVFNTIKCYK